jgi:purine-binding chemotaxis protein CheW
MEKELSSQRGEDVNETSMERVEEAEDLYERKERREEMLPIVIFRLSREWYGVEITKIKEILRKARITLLPSSPEYIAGIINFRGNILSVTDLKAILGLPRDEPTGGTRIIAIESGGLETGLLVDEVVETIEVQRSKIEPVPPPFPLERRKYLEGLFRWDNRFVALLSVERVLENKVSVG